LKPTVLNLVSYSGGKDSGALALHLQEQGLTNLVLVFCDTKWEHEVTYRYAFDFAKRIGLRLVVLDSEGMEALVKRKGRAPSSQARYCTDELKRKPFAAYVHGLHAKGFDTVVWLGNRMEESAARAKQPCDNWDDTYNCLVARGIHRWKLADVFAIHKLRGIPVNPLYTQGRDRVGCNPCCLENKAGLRAIAERDPEVFDVKLKNLEAATGRTWFSPGTTPDRFCSTKVWVEASEAKGKRKAKPGRWVPLATAADVKAWALSGGGRKGAPGDVSFLPVPVCQSRYALCE
jgi:3'-phosphoadenosine 5'-phosphosulfate sulfotransferase (PAPS reductase)/FAD synthetase